MMIHYKKFSFLCSKFIHFKAKNYEYAHDEIQFCDLKKISNINLVHDSKLNFPLQNHVGRAQLYFCVSERGEKTGYLS